MMQLGARGEALIKSFEKCRLVAYKPTPTDKWTIGWGHTGPEVVEGLVWTQEQADVQFIKDVAWAVRAVIATTDVELTQNQFDALVSFTFNVGVGNEAHSTLIALVNQRKFAAAAEEFPKWAHQGKVVLEGLEVRREAERKLFTLAESPAT